MYLFLIVYEEVLDLEITSLLDEVNLERYIKWDKVKGKWKEKHMGTHVWPGEYHTVCAMVKKEEVDRLKEKLKELQQKFPADELWTWSVPLEIVI